MVTTHGVESNVGLDPVSTDLVQRLRDSEAWNEWARVMNAQALVAGLVSEEEVAQGRAQAQEALARLRATKNGPVVVGATGPSAPKGRNDAKQV